MISLINNSINKPTYSGELVEVDKVYSLEVLPTASIAASIILGKYHELSERLYNPYRSPSVVDSSYAPLSQNTVG